MWKGIECCVGKWCQKLCTFLLDATYAFWKIGLKGMGPRTGEWHPGWQQTIKSRNCKQECQHFHVFHSWKLIAWIVQEVRTHTSQWHWIQWKMHGLFSPVVPVCPQNSITYCYNTSRINLRRKRWNGHLPKVRLCQTNNTINSSFSLFSISMKILNRFDRTDSEYLKLSNNWTCWSS